MTNKLLKCGLLEYDPVGELAIFNGTVAKFREGDKETVVLRLLMENKNHRVFYKTLIQQSIKNPIKKVILNDPRIWKKERELLKQIVQNIKRKLELPDGMIRCIGKRGYKLVDKKEGAVL